MTKTSVIMILPKWLLSYYGMTVQLCHNHTRHGSKYFTFKSIKEQLLLSVHILRLFAISSAEPCLMTLVPVHSVRFRPIYPANPFVLKRGRKIFDQLIIVLTWTSWESTTIGWVITYSMCHILWLMHITNRPGSYSFFMII